MLEGSLTPIAVAVPVFFALIGVELGAARWIGRSVYRLGDSVSNLGCGILQQVSGILLRGGLFGVYLLLHETLRVWTIPSTPWAWALCFVAVDFCYYWFHRLSHGVSFMWAAHVVHHQSEDYNLAVALRQGAFQGFFSWLFYLPLALLGFSPVMFAVCNSLNTLYQFWVHTRLIGRMGPLEWFLNTPSHHRVHHGRDPKYIDKNHAGALIIWDRMFGSFQREEEEPTYGITERLEFFDPVRAQLHPWRALWTRAMSHSRWTDRLKTFVMPPAWEPTQPASFSSRPLDDAKYDRPMSLGLSAYVGVQFAPLVPATVLFIYWRNTAPSTLLWGAACAMALTLASLSRLMEGARGGLALEQVRLLALPLALGFAATVVGGSFASITGLAALFALASWSALRRLAPAALRTIDPDPSGPLAAPRP